jgi:hypothetical protein
LLASSFKASFICSACLLPTARKIFSLHPQDFLSSSLKASPRFSFFLLNISSYPTAIDNFLLLDSPQAQAQAQAPLFLPSLHKQTTGHHV